MTKQEPPRNEKVYYRSTQHHPPAPTPPAAKPDAVWDKAQALLGDAPQATPASTAEPSTPTTRKRGAARRRSRRRRWVRVLDIAGSIVWIGIIVKLFIGDLDRDLLAAVAPGAVWILDLRWFAVLALAALLLLLFKRRTLGASIAYVLGYPLVLLFWKLPKLLIRRRSPLLVVGLAGIITGLASRAKLIVIALATACLSGLLIVLDGSPWLVGIGAVGMLTTLIWCVTVTAIDLLRTTSFLRAQEKFITWLLKHKVIEQLTTPDYPDQLTLKKWTAEDAKKFVDTVGNALLIRRVLRFWALSLDRYRKGPSVVILNAVAIVGLLVQVVVAFTFINYAVYLIDPGQFAVIGHPDLWGFAYYSTTASYFGEIDIISPTGDLAIIAKLLNGAIGAIGVVTIAGSLFATYRGVRADASSVSAVQLLKGKADEIRQVSTESSEMSLEELQGRLIAASWGMAKVLDWLLAKTPEEWAVEDRAESRTRAVAAPPS